MAVQVGFGGVFPDVEAVGAGEDVPVDGARLVARRVLAMLGEFDGQTLEW